MENEAVDLVNPIPDASILMVGCGPGVGVVTAATRVSVGKLVKSFDSQDTPVTS